MSAVAPAADRARGLALVVCAGAVWLGVWAVIAWDERRQDEWTKYAAEHHCQRVSAPRRFLDHLGEADRTYRCDTGMVVGPR